MNKKTIIYATIFYSIFFAIVLTIAGNIINTGHVDWYHFPVEFCAAAIIGTVMGLIIPGGKIAEVLSSKVATKESFFYELVFNSILIVIILSYMCPMMSIFRGCILSGVPLIKVIPRMFSMAPYFFVICVFLLFFVGKPIMKFSSKLASNNSV